MEDLYTRIDMEKKRFRNMAWLFFEDILKEDRDCWTEEKKESKREATVVPKFRANIKDALKVTHPGMCPKEIHAEIVVEEKIMPKVADGTWAGEAFGPNQDKLWYEYGHDMGSETSLR